tara:strand:+ start:255 stop:404 length:150 start_codon:yes stop_codon:yes gene_type:complete
MNPIDAAWSLLKATTWLTPDEADEIERKRIEQEKARRVEEERKKELGGE